MLQLTGPEATASADAPGLRLASPPKLPLATVPDGEDVAGSSVALQADEFASALVGLACSTIPVPYGRQRRGAPLVTAKMRETVNRRRAAHSLIRVLPPYSHATVLGRSLGAMMQRAAADPEYVLDTLDRLVAYYARWGVSSIRGGLSNLTRLRAYAEARGEYEAADSDVYPAVVSDEYLVSVRLGAKAKAERAAARAAAEQRQLTEQQARRDGSGAEIAAFRCLKWLQDNAKVETAADQPLVAKRKLEVVAAVPSPALEPPHYTQLCYLAKHHERREVRGTAGGFALVSQIISRFQQAQSSAILGERGDAIYTAVVLDKSNQPHKRRARPAFGPVLDAYGTRAVIDAVYDALEDVPEGNFLVRDTDSSDGAPTEGARFVDGPLLDGRADKALQYCLSLPPLSLKPPELLSYKKHSLKPMLLKHAARMQVDPVRRHGMGRFSGSAAQEPSLVPDAAMLLKHRLRCAKLPDRYAQATALAVDVEAALKVHADLRALVASKSIAQLAAMDWTGCGDEQEDDKSDDNA